MHATYRDEGPGEPTRVLGWGDLGLDTRERLAAALRGQGAPPLLSSRPALLRPPWQHAPVALAASGLLGLLAAFRFGEPEREPLLRSGSGQLAAALLAASALAALLLGARARRLGASRPYPVGLHLFAHELIDAQGPSLRLVPTSTLSAVRPLPGAVELSFEGGERYRLRCDDETASTLEEQLGKLRSALDDARDAGDMAALERLDPLWAERPRWRSRDTAAALAPAAPARWLWSPAPALLLALSAGLPAGLLAARAVADQSALVAAERTVDQGNVAHFQRLLAQGGAAAQAADRRWLQLALDSEYPDRLRSYLLAGGRERGRADDALFAMAERSGDPARLRGYLEVGLRHLARADELLYERALADGSRKALEAYIDSGGRRADRVRSEQLARVRIDEAKASRSPALLWRIAQAASPEVRTEALLAIEALYEAERRSLDERTGGRTELAHQLGVLLRLLSVGDHDVRVIPEGHLAGTLRQTFPPGSSRKGLDDLVYSRVTGVLTEFVSASLLRPRPPADEPAANRAADGPRLLVRYTLRPAPARPNAIQAEVELLLRFASEDDPSAVRLRFTSTDPALQGDRLFADDLGDALREALGERPPEPRAP